MSRSTGDQDASPSERMNALEQKAQAIRSRLFHAVDALDQRRHQVVAVGNYAKGVAKPAALSLLGLVAGVGIGVLVIRWAIHARRSRTLSARASRAIQRLDLVPKPSVGSRIFERVAVSILTLVATELMARLTKGVVTGKTGPRALPRVAGLLRGSDRAFQPAG